MYKKIIGVVFVIFCVLEFTSCPISTSPSNNPLSYNRDNPLVTKFDYIIESQNANIYLKTFRSSKGDLDSVYRKFANSSSTTESLNNSNTGLWVCDDAPNTEFSYYQDVLFLSTDEQSKGQIDFNYDSKDYIIKYSIVFDDDEYVKQITEFSIDGENIDEEDIYFELSALFPMFFDTPLETNNVEQYSAFLLYEIDSSGNLILTDDVNDVINESFEKIDNTETLSIVGTWKSEYISLDASDQSNYIHTLTINNNHTLNGTFILEYDDTSYTIAYSGKYDDSRLYFRINSLNYGSTTVTNNDDIIESLPDTIHLGILNTNIKTSDVSASGRYLYGMWQFEPSKVLNINGTNDVYNSLYRIWFYKDSTASGYISYYVVPSSDSLYFGLSGDFNSFEVTFNVTYIDANVIGRGEMRDENSIINYIKEVYNDDTIDSRSRKYQYNTYKSLDGIWYMDIYYIQGYQKEYVGTFEKVEN
ncbi:MAG: hypothetical protein PQJ45_12315 [Sphaerochaetaceae bacterium]|nr:hypothetical protein [Sphaerochaetaceae bacterium]